MSQHKRGFKAAMVEKAPADAPISPAVREIAEKKYGKQKLKLSNGIELIVPIDVYQNPDLFEFINHRMEQCQLKSRMSTK